MEISQRHPGTQHLSRFFFSYGHLPPHLQEISRLCCDLHEAMLERLPDGPEVSAGLRKLLEAKDCFVRASVDGPE